MTAASRIIALATCMTALTVTCGQQVVGASCTRQGAGMAEPQIGAETREVVRFQPGQPAGLRGPYLGQDPPAETAKVFAPGIVSTRGEHEFCVSFSPDGKQLYFNRGMTIMMSRLDQQGWTAPEPAPFNGSYRNHLPHMAFDNTRMFIGSSRPPQPYGIWLTERTDAGWSEPGRMWDGMYATSSRNGNVYFGIEGASGTGVLRTRLAGGRYVEPVAQHVSFADTRRVNAPVFHPAIAPDESFLVFDDNQMLHVSFRRTDGSWGEAVSLGQTLGERSATIPSVSPDGRFLFYSSESDVHWISTRVLEKLRPQQPSSGSSDEPREIFDEIRQGDGVKVRTLVERDPSLLDARNARKSTLLHIAVDLNNLPIARFLIEKGASPNARNAVDWTPLFYAKEIGMAGLLLEAGADVDSVAGDVSPLAQSVYRGDRQIADYLLSRGGRIPAVKTPIGMMTLIRALKIGSLQYFEESLRQGLDPLRESEGGSLWLHYAAESRSPELVDRLIGLGVPADRRNLLGLTPLHIAASRGSTAVVERLVERGANRNARTNDGKSPFNLAVEEQRGETAELLQTLGADQNPPRFPVLTGEYLGQPRPGKTAALFAPGIVSGRRTYHGSIVATPDGNELFWSVSAGRDITIYRARRSGGLWAEPQPFSAGDVPFVTPDGSKLYFVRWEQKGETAREMIFVRDRTPSGWSEPRALPETINSLPAIHWGVSVDRAGTLYFSAGERVRYSEYRNGRYVEPVVLDSLKDDNAYSPFVSPDGSYMLANTERDGEHPIILFKRSDGTWTKPIDLAGIIGAAHGFCPTVTPDGRYLFFVSMLDGIYVPYWMDASFIEALRKQALAG